MSKKFVPGSFYGPRNHQTHLAVMRAANWMTPPEFWASLRAAGVDPNALARLLVDGQRRGAR